MDNEEIKPLLVKYITGEASEADIAEVKEWISAHPENEQYFVQLYETWHNMLCLQPRVNKDNAYTKFLPVKPKKHVQLIKWGKVAAAIIVFAMLSILLIDHHTKSVAQLKQIAVNKGAIKKIILNDGTLVWLNAGSKLTYNADFGRTNRTVYLEGEAFFEIAPGKKTIPFLVNTKNYTIRDIGTKFNLKAYPNDPFFETTVVKGEVSVEGNINSNTHELNRIFVKPRQVLRIFYGPESDRDDYKPAELDSKRFNEIQVMQIDPAKMDQYDGWKDDLLVFDGSTLDEISTILQRRYNVKIVMDNELKDIRYSGNFKSIQSIDKVLDIIKGNTSIEYSITGGTINITKNKTNQLTN